MTRATLAEVLGPALRDGYAVPGFVCLGWEDARAYVSAARAERAPAILQAGPGARAHLPVAVWGAMFASLAEEADVPVVAHLDHGRTFAECQAGIAAGFTSVMIDGSDLPLAENIALTAAVARLAHDSGVSCEGEIGVVGYARGAASIGTDPEEAGLFVHETGVDALAVSVGNAHLQTEPGAGLDAGLLAAIAARTDAPLVIHGGSGVAPQERRALAAHTSICKFNMGTELRQTFGRALREFLARDAAAFDRLAILKSTEPPLAAAAARILRDLGASGRCR